METNTVVRRQGLLSGPIRHKYIPELNGAAMCAAFALCVGAMLLAYPANIAYAAVPSEVSSAINLISNGLKAFGIGLGVWGGVKVGTAVSNGSGASGNELSEGIGRVAGGVVIFGVATLFSTMLSSAGF